MAAERRDAEQRAALLGREHGHADRQPGDVGTDQDIEAFFACLSGLCCPTCGSADFNLDGDFGTDQDIEAFFACLSGLCCATCDPGGSDFNRDGDFGTDQDIEAFFRVLAGGTC